MIATPESASVFFAELTTLLPSRPHHQRRCSISFLALAATIPAAIMSHLHDTAKNVDKDSFWTLGSLRMMRKAAVYFVPLRCAAANVKKIGRETAKMLDDVHSRHGQSRRR